jgi:hypothetical protein
MRLGLVKMLVALFVLWCVWTVLSVSGYTNPIYMPGFDERRCPGCVKQAREHKNRDLVFSEIDPWQTVSNKVEYY